MEAIRKSTRKSTGSVYTKSTNRIVAQTLFIVMKDTPAPDDLMILDNVLATFPYNQLSEQATKL